jgi:hypothetical protein
MSQALIAMDAMWHDAGAQRLPTYIHNRNFGGLAPAADVMCGPDVHDG